MQNKLQELTEKIYREGITKGNTEAEQIVSNAKAESERILNDAKFESENIIKAAKKKSEEIKSNAEAELKLSSKQAINALKQEITDLINSKVVTSSVSEAVKDKEFLQKIIEIAVKNWVTSSDSPSVNVLIPESEEKKLNDYFSKSAKDLLNKGLKITTDTTLKSGFQISPKDGGYKISFTDDDFINFFKHYLRPKLVELLFGE